MKVRASIFLFVLAALLSISTCDLGSTPAYCKTLAEQPDRQREGDPEDYTDGRPEFMRSAVSHPPTDRIRQAVRPGLFVQLLQFLRASVRVEVVAVHKSLHFK